jgi:hypothetical protein
VERASKHGCGAGARLVPAGALSAPRWCAQAPPAGAERARGASRRAHGAPFRRARALAATIDAGGACAPWSSTHHGPICGRLIAPSRFLLFPGAHWHRTTGGGITESERLAGPGHEDESIHYSAAVGKGPAVPIRLSLSASHSAVFFSRNKSASAAAAQPNRVACFRCKVAVRSVCVIGLRLRTCAAGVNPGTFDGHVNVCPGCSAPLSTAPIAKDELQKWVSAIPSQAAKSGSTHFPLLSCKRASVLGLLGMAARHESNDSKSIGFQMGTCRFLFPSTHACMFLGLLRGLLIL